MQKIKSIIVENDPKSLSLLHSLILDYCPEIEVVSTASTIQDATKQIILQHPDLIFLDIELDDGIGFDVLHQIPDQKFKTIVISGYGQYAFDAFKFDIAHYLPKPVCLRDLRVALERVMSHKDITEHQKEKIETIGQNTYSQKKIQVSTDVGIKLINVNEIEFLEADGCYTLFHFSDKNSLISSKHLKNFECVLSGNNFYRIGRSHIINLDCIKVYNKHSGGKITMRSGSTIIIPRRNKDEFLKYLTTYLENLK